MTDLIDRLMTESELCRNEHADDIANLLNEAAEALRLYNLLVPFDIATKQSIRLQKVEKELEKSKQDFENLEATVER